MRLVPLMTLRATLRQPADIVGATPLGVRGIAEVTGGSFVGERLRGTVVTPGADWYLMDANGLLTVDVRATLRTDDEAFIFAQYFGRLHFNEAARNAMAAGVALGFGDTYFMTQPRFETGHPKYVWLNGIVPVAEGRLTADGVEYRVFECAHGE